MEIQELSKQEKISILQMQMHDVRIELERLKNQYNLMRYLGNTERAALVEKDVEQTSKALEWFADQIAQLQ